MSAARMGMPSEPFSNGSGGASYFLNASPGHASPGESLSFLLLAIYPAVWYTDGCMNSDPRAFPSCPVLARLH